MIKKKVDILVVGSGVGGLTSGLFLSIEAKATSLIVLDITKGNLVFCILFKPFNQSIVDKLIPSFS